MDMRRTLSDSGAVAAEFAIALPILIIILVGIFDYAQIVNESTKLFSAARAGAQYATFHPSDSGGIIGAVQHATSDAGMTVTLTKSTVDGTAQNPQYYYCTCASSTAAQVTCFPSGTICSGSDLRYYIGVNTQETFTPSPNLIYRGIGGSIALSGFAAVQVR
jgi:Flp pilus assembly protein TadG